VGGLVAGSEAAQLVVYERLLLRDGEFSPARRLRTVAAPELSAAVFTLLPKLAVTGLLSFDFLRDEDGVDWIHDVNPRVWGNFASLRFAGFDVLGSYVRWLRGTQVATTALLGSDSEEFGVFPADFTPFKGEPFGPRAVARLVGAAMRFSIWVGPRYSGSLVARAFRRVYRRLRP
jgi:hypothetical protein